ncbi:DUF6687 family protein [Pseudomonas putida]|jgi:hypothetical protein|uniref:DUF6687 family protein n=1 Tax=Pseudomonas putida TaxID=303 RepID=UPI003CC80BFD
MLAWRVLNKGVQPPPNTILVDDSCSAGDCLNIDHHIGHSTPTTYCEGATSTERVLNAIHRGLDPSSYEFICIRHYDADGLIAVWSLLNPGRAINHCQHLIAIAEYGDFYERWAAPFDSTPLAIALNLQEVTRGHWLRFCVPDTIRVSFQLKCGLVALEKLLAPCISNTRLHLISNIDTYVADVQAEQFVGLILSDHTLRLEHILRLCPSPICINAFRLHRDYWGYTIFLRPRFGWGYSEDVTCGFPIRTLEGLPEFLRLNGFSCKWLPISYDGAVWRLDFRGCHKSLPTEIAALAARWIEIRLTKI